MFWCLVEKCFSQLLFNKKTVTLPFLLMSRIDLPTALAFACQCKTGRNVKLLLVQGVVSYIQKIGDAPSSLVRDEVISHGRHILICGR